MVCLHFKIIHFDFHFDFHFDILSDLGGILAFMPPIGDIKITPFPIRFLDRFLDRPPDITLPSDFKLPQLLRWSLFPPEPNILYKLYEEGIRASDNFIAKNPQLFQKQ